jgi:drug/metabolite transporter (DMT)-like permease
LIKKRINRVDSSAIGSLRILFAAIFLMIIGFRSLAKIPKFKWKYIALTSMFGTFIPAYLFAIAQTQIDSSVSSILNSYPFKYFNFRCFGFGLQFKRNQIFGFNRQQEVLC